MEGFNIQHPDEGARRSRRKRAILGAGVLAALVILLVLTVCVLIDFTGAPNTYAVALGDLDGDGDLDTFYANGKNESPAPNTILINQGGAQEGRPGNFRVSDQRLGNENSRSVTLGDLDGDSDLDAWVANVGYHSIFFNDGQGGFSDQNQSLYDDRLGGTGLWKVALGDMDGDGDLDAVGGGCCGALESSPDRQTLYEPFNLVWTNQGGAQGGQPGDFEDSGQTLESLGARGVSLGDLDGDGDLDAFFGNEAVFDDHADPGPAEPDTVWWNDGRGSLTDSGQRLGQTWSVDVALGDLDGDGDLDAYSANRSMTPPYSAPNEVWLNSGGAQGGQPGIFVDSGQRLGNAFSNQIFLADLDSDHDLDATLVNRTRRGLTDHLEIWLNDGLGNFSDSGQRIAYFRTQAFVLGDLDSDGDIDLFAGWYPNGYQVWWNRGNGSFSP